MTARTHVILWALVSSDVRQQKLARLSPARDLDTTGARVVRPGDAAVRFDSEPVLVRLTIGVDHLGWRSNSATANKTLAVKRISCARLLSATSRCRSPSSSRSAVANLASCRHSSAAPASRHRGHWEARQFARAPEGCRKRLVGNLLAPFAEHPVRPVIRRLVELRTNLTLYCRV